MESFALVVDFCLFLKVGISEMDNTMKEVVFQLESKIDVLSNENINLSMKVYLLIYF